MPSSREYLSYIMERLAPLEGITTRQMMGEYIIYYQGKIAAELCDDRLLVKPVPAALALLPDAPQEPPYPGAKPMLLVEEVKAVSYTHLDVYKRQIQYRVGSVVVRPIIKGQVRCV